MNGVSLAGFAPSANATIRIVSIFQPGTNAYLGVSSAYSPGAFTVLANNGDVNFDLVTFAEGNTWKSTSTSGNLQDASKWSTGAPTPSTRQRAGTPNQGLSTNVFFGPNVNSTVTVTNTVANFSLLSITFAPNSTTAYTLGPLGSPSIQLGHNASTSAPNYGLLGLTSLVNNSSLTQTISSDVTIFASQVWDSGSTPGGAFVLNGTIGLLNLNANNPLTITGANNTTINGQLAATPGAAVVKTGTGTLILTASSPSAPDMFTVNQGTLRVNNPRLARPRVMAR